MAHKQRSWSRSAVCTGSIVRPVTVLATSMSLVLCLLDTSKCIVHRNCCSFSLARGGARADAIAVGDWRRRAACAGCIGAGCSGRRRQCGCSRKLISHGGLRCLLRSLRSTYTALGSASVEARTGHVRTKSCESGSCRGQVGIGGRVAWQSRVCFQQRPYFV